MFRLLLTFALVCAAASLQAQAPTPQPTPSAGGATTALPLFRVTLPGGTYSVAVRSIVSVSSHEYLVDGAVRVLEVNIDTTGSVLARFYFIEPNLPGQTSAIGALGTASVEKAQQMFLQPATEKTGVDAWKKVVKSYPTTTHARTVEYRVVKKEDLATIHDAAEESFRLQRNKQIKIE